MQTTTSLHSDNFKIEQATGSPEDIERYVTACNEKHFYSMRVINSPATSFQAKQTLELDRAYHKFAKAFHPTTSQDYFTLIQNGNIVFFMFDNNNVDYGFAVIKYLSPTTVLIGDFSVYTHLNGYGTIFYNLLEQDFKKKGITMVNLSPWGDGAKAFWEKKGFKPEFFTPGKYYKPIK